MKESLIIAAAIILILISCELNKSDPVQTIDYEVCTELEIFPKKGTSFSYYYNDIELVKEINNDDSTEQDTFFKIGTNLGYKYSDIELYDASTHILYFKTNHPEFDTITQSSFGFYVDGDVILEGDFWPGRNSFLPTGPYIHTCPFWNQNYALEIEYEGINRPDLINDPRIIQALINHNLFHPGLLVIINSIESNGSQISFSFTITNQDQSTLLIFDPCKMGLNLFHYFTNGLEIENLTNNTHFTVNIPYEKPSPWNSWKIDWLSKISPGESKAYLFNYPIDYPLNPGEYEVHFSFPGLSSQVNKDQLIQDNGRIWLGDIRVIKNFVIESHEHRTHWYY